MSWLRTLYKCLRLRLSADETSDTRAGIRLTLRPTTPSSPLGHPHLPRVLSSEECVPPAASASSSAEATDDMHTWMRDEDARRECIFHLSTAAAQQPASPKPSSPRQSAKRANASFGYDLARRQTRHIYCCGACGAPLYKPQSTHAQHPTPHFKPRCGLPLSLSLSRRVACAPSGCAYRLRSRGRHLSRRFRPYIMRLPRGGP